jgi:lipoteichoic acid synthase
MTKNIKIFDFIFIFSFCLYMEIVFKYVIFNSAFDLSLLTILLLSLPISLIIYFLTHLFNHKFNKFLLFTILLIITFIFMSQVVYFKTYNSIFSFYSMREATDVLEYSNAIIDMILNNIFLLSFFIIPLCFFIFFNKDLYSFNKINLKNKLFIGVMFFVTSFLAIFSLNFNKDEMYSGYNLYYKDHAPILMTKKLGLLTSMRIDFQRMMFGFNKSDYHYNKTIKKHKEIKLEKDKIIEYNKLDINFDDLINKETNITIKNMHQYFNNVELTEKNKYTGLFEGKNLILILAEAFDPIAVDKDITPTLYKLVNNGIKFNNFYTPLFPVSTSDGEYIATTSLIPKEGVWSFKESYNNYLPFTLANMLKNNGYTTTAYHDHSGTYYNRNLAIPNIGYDKFYACKMGLNINCKRWTESDLEMINITVPDYINSKDSFLTYYITVSGHLNYTITGNTTVKNNWNLVKDLPYSTLVKGYMGAQKELDLALESLINQLESANKLDNTVIALNSDHYPYGLSLDEINEKSSYIRDDNFEKHRSAFIVWNNQIKEPIVVNKLTSNMDILPTLANLFNLKYDSRLLMGKDAFSDNNPIVIFSNRSWITDKGRYNSLTKEFISNGDKVSQKYIDDINQMVYDKFLISSLVLEKDYYKIVFNK